METIMMKKLLMIPAVMVILLLTACNPYNTQNNTNTSSLTDEEVLSRPIGLYYDWTFEELLLTATDVVVARYVGHRPLGQTMIEYEFVVLDRVLGSVADTIFIYEYMADNYSLFIPEYISENYPFSDGTEYLLILERIPAPFYSGFHYEAFVLISNTVIDLNNPSAAMMRNTPLSEHSTGLDFNSRSLSSDQIVSYVKGLTQNNVPSRAPITSDRTEDIIEGSPHVLVVEINEPMRLSRRPEDWAGTDLYYFTVIQSLKGGLEEGHRGVMVFFADTVQQGDHHIVAAVPIREGSNWFEFTSRHSLFRMDQLDEIKEILGYTPIEQVAHTVSIANGAIGASASLETATAGQVVTINAGVATDSLVFAGWTSESNIVFADSRALETTFTMVDEDVTVTANWRFSAIMVRITHHGNAYNPGVILCTRTADIRLNPGVHAITLRVNCTCGHSCIATTYAFAPAGKTFSESVCDQSGKRLLTFSNAAGAGNNYIDNLRNQFGFFRFDREGCVTEVHVDHVLHMLSNGETLRIDDMPVFFTPALPHRAAIEDAFSRELLDENVIIGEDVVLVDWDNVWDLVDWNAAAWSMDDIIKYMDSHAANRANESTAD